MCVYSKISTVQYKAMNILEKLTHARHINKHDKDAVHKCDPLNAPWGSSSNGEKKASINQEHSEIFPKKCLSYIRRKGL